MYSVQLSICMLLIYYTHCLFHFPVRHTANFRFDGRHCIGDLMVHTMVWKLLYSEYDR